MSDEPAIRREGEVWLLNVKARPGARTDRIRGVSAGLVQVDVAAVAEGGKATEHLLVLLAKAFGVARRDVELVSGAHARWKRVRVNGGALPEGLLGAAVGPAGG